jgi:citrate lyase alpha subunit
MNYYTFKSGTTTIIIKELREDLALEIAKEFLDDPVLVEVKGGTTSVIYLSNT